MKTPRRPAIVLLGMITTMPVGGVIWQTWHYLEGLRRLGFEVYYVEDHGMWPAMFTDQEDPYGSEPAAAFLRKLMERFGLADHWSYCAWHTDERCFGLDRAQLAPIYAEAAAVLNLHGGTVVRPEHRRGGALLYVETDPVATEIELHRGVKATADFLDQHTAHFTFGENLGAPDCRVPLPPAKYRFHATRQPVVCDFWESDGGPAECFTTIANWRQPVRETTLDGELYTWSKHHEFLKFLELPRKVAQPFELALSSFEPADREMLQAHGWRVRPALEFTRDLEAYRAYIRQSRGEWTVAKDQNVRLRSGWFSDRAATYLAAGRPVITQETGFSNVLPTGEGLFAFRELGEVIAAVETINADYPRHARAAAEIAREFFGAEAVLAKMLEQAGVEIPRR